MTRRAVAYIDGFNFYNGCVRDQPALKWLDLRRLCETLVRGCEFDAVRYYTAKVFDMPGRDGQRRRQEVYLRALGTLDVDIVFGQFKRREKSAALVKPLADGTEIVRIKTNEEKGSDVNLATDLLWDVLTDGMDLALVLSNDFDLQRPIERVMSRGVEVVTVNPHRHRRQRPSLTSTRTVNLRRWHLVNCQLPDTVVDSRGRTISRPTKWA
jgi:uncharacterized LabA/DUF88 family protein